MRRILSHSQFGVAVKGNGVVAVAAQKKRPRTSPGTVSPTANQCIGRTLGKGAQKAQSTDNDAPVDKITQHPSVDISTLTLAVSKLGDSVANSNSCVKKRLNRMKSRFAAQKKASERS